MASVSNTYSAGADGHRLARKGKEGKGENSHRFAFLADALPSMTAGGAPPLLAPSPHKMNWHGLDCRLGTQILVDNQRVTLWAPVYIPRSILSGACRAGWGGILSEAHYDYQRNFIALVGGRKRYFLLPPNACHEISLLPYGHPSARHSRMASEPPYPPFFLRACCGACCVVLAACGFTEGALGLDAAAAGRPRHGRRGRCQGSVARGAERQLQ
jgi:hypothetical protein